MDVVLVGTGSADGWPNPFCRCASCASQDADGVHRRPTAALVDDVLLLDCGTGVPAAALAAGHRLDRLRAVLLTHDHPDHSAPMALLARSWASTGEGAPLQVVGPAAVLDTWRPWCGPYDRVDFRAVEVGDVVEVAGYTVRVLAADHDQPAVLYLLEAPDGARLLYATDTGPLPASAVEAVSAAPVDLLLLEETFGDRHDHGTRHLDLRTFPEQLRRLRAAGALRDGCDVVAVHLGHHNPPEPRLTARLAAWGARPASDGDTLHVLPTSPVSMQKSAIPRRTLVLGGARSGKSSAAERLLAAEDGVLYLATGPVPDDADVAWAERVRLHREQRPSAWRTVEDSDAARVLRSATGPVLLDCLGTWLSTAMHEAGAWDDRLGWEKDVEARVDALLDAWRAVTAPVVAVSNEVGSGVVPATRSGGLYRDWLGRLNRRVADETERVLLVVAGRTIDLSSGPS